MLNLIRNNFPKGCLVRFLTDLATKIEKWQKQNVSEICQKSKRGTLSKIRQFTLGKLSQQAVTNFWFIKILIMHAHSLNDLTQLDPKT
jgi:hypothetical protein